MPRLDALIARNSGLSRKQVTRLFRAGRIADEAGQRLDDPRLALTPSELPRRVLVDEQVVVLRVRYDLMLHKPAGVVTALRDARHRTAAQLVADAPLFRDLRAVGRLDKDTVGLLLWTTDGELLHKLTHPRYALPRTYEAALAGPFAAPQPDLVLDDGHAPSIVELKELEPRALHPATPRPEQATVFATITITTGRFHEVRRIFAALGTQVVGLCRVAYGPLGLPAELEPGQWQEVDLKGTFRGLHPAS